MTNKTPIYYTEKQMTDAIGFACTNFGNGDEGTVMHELESEYVHTDVLYADSALGGKMLATFGMGARKMKAHPDFSSRIELVMFASDGMDADDCGKMVACSQLTAFSKFPFRENTWFGPWHTVTVSDMFKEKYGFDAFIFYPVNAHAEISRIGKVEYLVLLPIYQDELEFIMENEYSIFLEWLFEEYGEDAFLIDRQREHLMV